MRNFKSNSFQKQMKLHSACKQMIQDCQEVPNCYNVILHISWFACIEIRSIDNCRNPVECQ